MSAEIVRVLESATPWPYGIVVATEHELLREVAYWRDLLARVANDMERSSARDDDIKRRRWFETRSTRIRELLVERVPSGWSAMTSTVQRR